MSFFHTLFGGSPAQTYRDVETPSPGQLQYEDGASEPSKFNLKAQVAAITKIIPQSLKLATDKLTNLFNALNGNDRNAAEIAVDEAIEHLTNLIKKEEEIGGETLYQNQGCTPFILEEIAEGNRLLLKELKEYQACLDRVDILSEEHIKIGTTLESLIATHTEDLAAKRSNILYLLQSRRDHKIHVARSLQIDPEQDDFFKKRRIHRPSQVGLLVVLQELYFQKGGPLSAAIDPLVDALTDRVVAQIPTGVRKFIKSTFSSVSNKPPVPIDTPKRAPNIAIPAVPEKSQPKGFMGWVTDKMAGMTTSGIPFISQIVPDSGLWLLDRTLPKLDEELRNAKTEEKKAACEEAKKNLNEIKTILEAVKSKEIPDIDCLTAFHRIHELASKQSVWLGDFANFDLLPEGEQKIAKLSIQELEAKATELRQQFPDKDHLPDNADYTDIFEQELRETGHASTGKTAHGLFTWALGAISPALKEEFSFPNIYERADLYRSKSIRENLISEVKRMISKSGSFFLKRWVLQLLVRPMFWLMDLGVASFIEKIKGGIKDLLGKTEKPTLDKTNILIKPLETMKFISTHLGIVLGKPYENVNVACREYFTKDQDFLKNKGDMQSLSLKAGDKLVDDYLFRVHPSKKLHLAREKISLWVFAFQNVFVRGLLSIVVSVFAKTPIWIVEKFILVPFETIFNAFIHKVTKVALRKTNAIYDILKAAGSALKSPEAGAPAEESAINQSILMTDRIKIDLFEELLMQIEDKSDPESDFSTMQVPAAAKKAMHDFIVELLNTVRSQGGKDSKIPTTPIELLGRLFGEDAVNKKAADFLEELFTRSYYVMTKPKILTKLLTRAARSTRKSFVEKDKFINKEELVQEHKNNQERIEYLRLLVLKKAIKTLANKSNPKRDEPIEKHAKELKARLLPPAAKAEPVKEPIDKLKASLQAAVNERTPNNTPRNLLANWTKELASLNTLEPHQASVVLLKIKTELEDLLKFVREDASLLSIKDKAGSGSLNNYMLSLVPFREALGKFVDEIKKIYGVYLEMSIPEQTTRATLKDILTALQNASIRDLIARLPDIDQMLADPSTNEETLEKTLHELNSVQEEINQHFNTLESIDNLHSGHDHLIQLVQSVRDTKAKLNNFRRKIEEYLSYKKAVQSFENLFSSSAIKGCKTDDEFKRSVILKVKPLYNQLFPGLFPQEINSNEKPIFIKFQQQLETLNTTILWESQQSKNDTIAISREQRRQEVITTLVQYKKDQYISLLRDNELPLAQSLDSLTQKAQNSLSFINQMEEQFKTIYNPNVDQAGSLPSIAKLLSTIPALEQETRNIKGYVPSIQIPLDNVIEPIGEQLIPEISLILQQVSKLWLEQDGPLMGFVLKRGLVPFTHPEEEKK